MNNFLTRYRDAEITDDHFVIPSVMTYTHAHPVYELYFCPHTVQQTSVINGVSYTYSYPTAILSAPYTVHSMSCDDLNAEKFERYVYYFDESFFDTFGKGMIPDLFRERNTGLMFALNDRQGAYLKRMIDLCAQNDSIVQKKLTLAMFFNKLTEFCPSEDVVRVGSESFYIKNILQYMSEHTGEYTDSDEIAKKFAVSRSKLERDFKRFTGMTVHSFSEMCKINKAKGLLQNEKKMSIAEIAQRCGFESENYFFPFFKKHTGRTPLEFRKSGDRKRAVDLNSDENCGCSF